jgi:hypothetical protein
VRRAVENTARLLRLAARRRGAVAACYMGYHSERDAPYWKVAGIGELRDGDPGTALDPLIADPSYDYVLRKGAPSIFFNTPAAAYFAKNRVDTMIVTGLHHVGLRARPASSTASASASAPSGRRTASATTSRRRMTAICAMWSGATPTSAPATT